MGTWETGTTSIECRHCGAKYEAQWADYPARDRGKQNCECCGQILLEWHGTRDYDNFVLKERGQLKATKLKKRPRDPIQLAKLVGDIATGQVEDREQDHRNPAAVALGKLGGAKGGKARAAKLSPERRKEIAQKAGQTRWSK
jgi:hypothetical protein